MKDILTRYIRDELLDRDIHRDLSEDDDLLTGGLLDSLGMMSLVTFIEDRFGIRVPPEDVTVESFSTVGQIARYLEARRAETAGHI